MNFLNARAARSGLALFAMIALPALAGCLETTEPNPIVEARVAHAAPGLGTANVRINGTPVFNLAPGQNNFFPLNAGVYTYRFVTGQDSTEIQVNHTVDISAIILLDRDNPTARHYQLERQLNQVRLLVINGDFTTSDPMQVVIEGSGQTFDQLLGPGDQFALEAAAGTFQIGVRPSAEEEPITLQPITVFAGDNGFLVLVPVGDPVESYDRVLF